MSMTSDGVIVSVSAGLPSAYTFAAYEAKTYTEVGAVVDVGEIGAVFADVATYNVATRNVGHLKGSRDWGSTPVTVDNITSDAGQQILKDHHNGNNINGYVSIKLKNTQSGAVEFFSTMVYSFTSSALAQDSIYRATVEFRVKSNSYVYDSDGQIDPWFDPVTFVILGGQVIPSGQVILGN